MSKIFQEAVRDLVKEIRSNKLDRDNKIMLLRKLDEYLESQGVDPAELNYNKALEMVKEAQKIA